jgi:hypothetical protein
MAAWLVGIGWTLAPSPWVDESTPATALILIYGIAGLCMAATVAIVTGAGIIRLMPPPIEIGTDGERSSSRSRHHAWST